MGVKGLSQLWQPVKVILYLMSLWEASVHFSWPVLQHSWSPSPTPPPTPEHWVSMNAWSFSSKTLCILNLLSVSSLCFLVWTKTWPPPEDSAFLELSRVVAFGSPSSLALLSLEVSWSLLLLLNCFFQSVVPRLPFKHAALTHSLQTMPPTMLTTFWSQGSALYFSVSLAPGSTSFSPVLVLSDAWWFPCICGTYIWKHR